MNGEYEVDDWPDTGGTQTSDYEVALEAFRFLSGGQSDTEISPSLRALQQPLRDLRASYKNDAVKIEYTPAHSLAYLMAYVPLYIEMAERAVKLALQPSDLKTSMEIALVGAGPAPEAVALSNLAKQTNGQCLKMRVHLFDRATPAWRESRAALAHVIRNLWPEGSFTFEEYDVDILKPGVFQDLSPVLTQCDLVMAQNCMNETLAASVGFQENLCSLAEGLGEATTLILADQYKYTSVRDRIRNVEKLFRSYGVVRRSFEDSVSFTHRSRVPTIVRGSLLTGSDGLIPRKYVDFGVSIFQSHRQTQVREQNYQPVETGNSQVHRLRTPIVRRDRSENRRRDLERIRGSQPAVRRELEKLVKTRSPVQGQVLEALKNGVYVDVRGVRVFIDVVDLESRGSLPDPRMYMGRQLTFELVDVGPHSAKGNRRSLLAKQRLGFEQSTKIGDRVIARVREIRVRTVILEINNVYLSVHLSELSHNWISEPAEVLSIGELVEVEITEILNRSNVWAYASVKRCIPDELVQFDVTHERGELVRCIVVEVNERISILDLLGMEARIHVDSLGEQGAADCASVLHEGQILWAKYLGFLSRGSKGRYLQVSMKDLGGFEKVAREFVEARNSEKAEER